MKIIEDRIEESFSKILEDANLLSIYKNLRTALLLVDTDQNRAKQVIKATLKDLENYEL